MIKPNYLKFLHDLCFESHLTTALVLAAFLSAGGRMWAQELTPAVAAAIQLGDQKQDFHDTQDGKDGWVDDTQPANDQGISGGTLLIQTTSLPEGNPQVPYHATFSAQGGTGTYAWHLYSGQLPPGLGLSSTTGVVRGLPKLAGAYSFTLLVSDKGPGHGQSATATFTLVVKIPNPGDPQLPQVFIQTNFPKTTNYTVVTVPAGADLQAAIDNAACSPYGTVLRLASGATFEGNFTLPAKSCSPGQWIIIRTDTADSNLPPAGVRIGPSYSPALARIFTDNVAPAISTASNASHFWLMGVEIGTDPSVTLNYGVVVVGNEETKVSALPDHIFLDRCYVHGNATGEIKRGLQANGKNLAALNSYFANFHSTGQDAQAIAAWNSPGPLKIVNNYLEGSGENLMLGGSAPTIDRLIQSDVEIRLNHIAKPLSWKPDDPSYGGILWVIKNLMEFKNAQRVLVEGNIIENNWAGAQNGYGVLFTPRGQAGKAPWSTVANVTFRYNVFQHSGSGFNIGGEDNTGTSQPSQFINIRDNLMVDINGWGGADGTLYQLIDGSDGSNLLPPHDITLDHNTAFQVGNVITVGAQLTNPIPHLVTANNIAPHNQYGIIGVGTGIGNPTINVYFSPSVITNDVIAALPSNISPSQYPPGNFFPPDWPTVQFVDFANGNYSLLPTSPYYQAGTDGEDIGTNFGAVSSATFGVAP